jgi:hypothetical protein
MNTDNDNRSSNLSHEDRVKGGKHSHSGSESGKNNGNSSNQKMPLIYRTKIV